MAFTTLLIGSVDCNDRVSTRLMAMTLGKPGREAEEYGGPTVDIAAVGSVDTSQLVESRFTVEVSGASVDAVSAIVASIAAEVRDLADITVGLADSSYTGTLKVRIGECVEIPLDSPWDSMLMNTHTTRVEIVVRREPWVYGAAETLHNAAALILPALVGMSEQTGEFAAPLDQLVNFAALECNSIYAGRYPDADGSALIDDFAIKAVDLTWSTISVTTDAAGYPDGAGNTVERRQSATEVFADIDVTDFEPGEYLLVAKCKATTANTGYVWHTYSDAAVPIPTTTLQLLPLGTVALPCEAVRGSASSKLRVYLAGDGTNYGYVNAFFFIPASFGGLIGWRRSSGHAHELRWENNMVYADDLGALGEAFGGRQIVGKGGVLVAVAEQVAPAPTTACALTVLEVPRFEQFPTSAAAPTWASLIHDGVVEAVYPANDLGFTEYEDDLRIFMPAATNLCTDPQGTDTTFWPTGITDIVTTANATVYVDVPDAPHIIKSIRYAHTYDGTNDRVVETAKVAVSASKAYQVALLAAGFVHLGGTCELEAVVYSAADAEVRTVPLGDFSAMVAGVWDRYSAKVTTAASGEAKLALRATFSGANALDRFTLQASGLHIVQETVLTRAFDGSADGCAWSGAANASTSTRTVSGLDYAPIAATLGTEGTYAVRYAPDHTQAETSRYGIVAGDYEGTAPTMRAAIYINAGAAFRMQVGTASTRSALTFAAKSIHTAVGRWNPYGVFLNHDGITAVAGAAPTVGGAVDRFMVGNRRTNENTAAYSLTGGAGPVIRTTYFRTDAWTAAIQADDGAAFDDPVTLCLDYMQPGDLIYPLGMDSIGYRKLSGGLADGLGAVIPDNLGVMVFEGNSLTMGIDGGGAVLFNQDYPTVMLADLYGMYWPWTMTNVAEGSHSTTMLIAESADVDSKYDATAGKRNILCFWEGYLDLRDENQDAAISYSNLVDYCLARKAAGWEVVILTLPPNTQAGLYADYETDRLAVNTLLRANWASFADALADVASSPVFDAAADTTNTTYFQADRLHLTAAGYAVVAGIVKTALESIL